MSAVDHQDYYDCSITHALRRLTGSRRLVENGRYGFCYPRANHLATFFGYGTQRWAGRRQVNRGLVRCFILIDAFSSPVAGHETGSIKVND